MKEQTAKKIQVTENEKPQKITEVKKSKLKKIGIKGYTAFKIHAGKSIP